MIAFVRIRRVAQPMRAKAKRVHRPAWMSLGIYSSDRKRVFKPAFNDSKGADDMKELTDFEFVDGYLERIEVQALPTVDPDGLIMLQTSHLKHIPFENLDIINGDIPLALDEASLWDKLVARRRGGICYEQNILFAAVLEKLGFTVKRMASHHPVRGRDEYDHMFLMVDFPEREETWISDVGYGFNNFAPVRFKVGVWQSDLRDMLRIDVIAPGRYILVRRDRHGNEDGMYEFNLDVHTNEQYRARCDWFSTNEESRFKQGPFVALDDFGGRKLLTTNHFRHYVNDEEVKEKVEGPEEFDRILKEEFGIVL